jgi:hypothetical protein
VLEKHAAQQPDVLFVGERAIRDLRDQEHPFGLLQLAKIQPSGLLGSWRFALRRPCSLTTSPTGYSRFTPRTLMRCLIPPQVRKRDVAH